MQMHVKEAASPGRYTVRDGRRNSPSTRSTPHSKKQQLRVKSNPRNSEGYGQGERSGEGVSGARCCCWGEAVHYPVQHAGWPRRHKSCCACAVCRVLRVHGSRVLWRGVGVHVLSRACFKWQLSNHE